MKPPPARAYLFTDGGLKRALDVARYDTPTGVVGEAVHVQLALPHDHFVIEHAGLAARVMDRREPGDRNKLGHGIRVCVYFRRGRTRWHDFADMSEAATEASRWGRTAEELADQPGLDVLRRAIYMIAALGALTRIQEGRTEDPGGLLDDPSEPDPDRPVVALRRGDTLRYERVPIRRAPRARDAPAEALIRRREHEVRGHWRRLRSGEYVWVRAHARGDPELGRVETHYVME